MFFSFSNNAYSINLSQLIDYRFSKHCRSPRIVQSNPRPSGFRFCSTTSYAAYPRQYYCYCCTQRISFFSLLHRKVDGVYHNIIVAKTKFLLIQCCASRPIWPVALYSSVCRSQGGSRVRPGQRVLVNLVCLCVTALPNTFGTFKCFCVCFSVVFAFTEYLNQARFISCNFFMIKNNPQFNILNTNDIFGRVQFVARCFALSI